MTKGSRPGRQNVRQVGVNDGRARKGEDDEGKDGDGMERKARRSFCSKNYSLEGMVNSTGKELEQRVVFGCGYSSIGRGCA